MKNEKQNKVQSRQRFKGSKSLAFLNLSLFSSKHFLLKILFCFLLSENTFAYIAEDTIIVNVGKKKKIILWGETKEDLRELEKYDLNLILRQMNQDLDEIPSDVKKMIRRDFEGNTYEKQNEEAQYLSSWQKLKRNTYLNISVGLTSSKILLRDIQKNTTEPFGLPKELYEQKLASSPNINFSLIRHENFLRSGRKEILLRYGIDLSWFYLNQQSTKQTGYDINYGIKTDTLLIYTPSSSGNYYLASTYKSTDRKSTWKSIPDESLLYTNFKIIPTINFYDSKGNRTINLGFGAYIGTLLNGSQIIKKADSFDRRGLKIPIRGEDNPVRYGLVINAGYRAINLFLESDINNLFQNRQERSSWSQNLTTFGIRLGR